jgi:hygromycin-B 7''-O-kinase
MMRLPGHSDPQVFDGFRLQPAAWRAAVVEVCAAHGVASGVVSAFAEGSNLVAAVDDRWVVKIFPPFHAHQWDSERRVLAHLAGKELPVRVPGLVAEGTRSDGWSYVIIEKLPGLQLDACWPSFSLHDKERVLEQIGATMATVHRTPLGELADLQPEWDAFLRGQRAGARKRHADRGVPEWLENGLSELTRTWTLDDAGEERVLLTGEYTPFNLLVDRDGVGWTLTGMFDFGDAMVGPRAYDFLGPSMFSCGGDPRLVAALFRGYFDEEHAISQPERMRLMTLAVLHRYAHFELQLRIPSWRERADSFETLAELIWPSIVGPRLR